MAGLFRWSLAGIGLVAMILVPFLLFEADILGLVQRLFAPGRVAGPLLALVILGLLAGDVFLPVPSSLVSVAAVALYGWAGGVLIWLGMSMGCGVGYWLGSRAGRPLALRFLGRSELERAQRIAAGLGAPTLVLTRAVPVFAEAATVAAGLAAMPLRRFAAATGLANAGIALLYAAAGEAAAGSGRSFLMLFAAAVVLPALAWLALRAAAPIRSA